MRRTARAKERSGTAKPGSSAGRARPRNPEPRSEPAPQAEQRGQRLQKVLAAAGVGSRRQCEQLILEGRVEVDRQVVTQLGTRVDPQQQEVRVDGQRLRLRKPVYFAVNKPRGVVSTSRDPAGRLRVIDLIASDERLFTVGRLDKSSEGLLIVTNDGTLAHRLTHPSFGVPKTYLVEVAGVPQRQQLERLRRGVHLAEGIARVAQLKVRRRRKQSATLEMVLTEGRNREIRRLLARIGHKVMRLKRTAVGPLKLGGLEPGQSRRLTAREVENLQRAAGMRPVARQQRRPRAGRRKTTTAKRRPK